MIQRKVLALRRQSYALLLLISKVDEAETTQIKKRAGEKLFPIAGSAQHRNGGKTPCEGFPPVSLTCSALKHQSQRPVAAVLIRDDTRCFSLLPVPRRPPSSYHAAPVHSRWSRGFKKKPQWKQAGLSFGSLFSNPAPGFLPWGGGKGFCRETAREQCLGDGSSTPAGAWCSGEATGTGGSGFDRVF